MPSASPTPKKPTNTELNSEAQFRQPGVAGKEEENQESTTKESLEPSPTPKKPTNPELNAEAQLIKVAGDQEEKSLELSPTPAGDAPVQVETESPKDHIEDLGAIFQAVGVITGEVEIGEDGKNTITISNNKYPLFYITQKFRVFEALKKEIETTGKRTQRLVVYPKAIHFPRKEQPHQIAFQLVGFDTGRFAETVSGELDDMEFKFSGLWQFIPVCPTPCISVFRNFSRSRLDYIKQADPVKKVRFMKASHLPLLWKDAPLRPFRFNPKVSKQEQGQPSFVTLKAKFLPGRDVFGFVALLAPPQETPPRFLKASKQDKATVQQQSKKNNKPFTPRPVKSENQETHNQQPKPILKKKTPEVEKQG